MAETYRLPADLVHRAIWAILGCIGLVGLYMVVWAINFAVFEGEMRALQLEVAQIQKDLKAHNEKPCHDVACEQIRNLIH